MPAEHALAQQVRAHLLATRATEVLHREAAKGCQPGLANQPVALEPAYRSIGDLRPLRGVADNEPWILEASLPENELRQMEAWISPQQVCDWQRAESFLKQLALARRRIVFGIVGNSKRIAAQFLCQRADEAVLRTAFKGQFEHCELSAGAAPTLPEGHDERASEAVFSDYYPLPPYSHLFTRPDELQRSPFATLIQALTQIPPSAVGIYQVVFQAVAPDHNWHQNVQGLFTLEFNLRLQAGSDPRRYAQQNPEGDLRQMALQLEDKAHNDKPFFAVALRIAVLNGEAHGHDLLRALELVTGLIQHGGQRLCALSEVDYRQLHATDVVRNMFLAGATYRPGFLANSAELAALVHLPSSELTAHIHSTELNKLETLPPSESLSQGTPLGYCAYAGVQKPVCIGLDVRDRHCHVIGRPGMGKSRLLEGMLLDDVDRGAGVALIDPHGDLVERILELIPERAIDRVIYFNPGDPDWVPLWNPLQPIPGHDPGRMADDLVSAIKKIVEDWGDRLDHILRNIFYGVLCLPGSKLQDVSTLLRTGNERGDELRRAILGVVRSATARDFWECDFKKYNKDDLGPPRNKLSKLLLSGTVSLMLSQAESAFNFRQIMDTGQVLLVDLSGLGGQLRDVLGCLMIALLNLTAISRSKIAASQRREFHIYCDEAHRFMTDSLAEIITQARKYKVSLTLAHHYMRQFSTAQADAIASVGSAVVFNVDQRDAAYLTKDMQGLVEAKDLITLEPFQAIARIGGNVVRFRTTRPPAAHVPNYRDEIIRRSHARYYKPTGQVRAELRARSGEWAGMDGPPPPEAREREHDTFD